MRLFLLILSFCLIMISGVIDVTAGAIEPPERNIIYIHVPAAICALVCFCVLFICSIGYLRTKQQQLDYTAAAAAEVGLVFATVLNVTGAVFAYAQWGVWWTPSPRLISSAILWFLYVAYLILRGSFNGEGCKEQVSAVFGIIAFIDIPLVIISARFIRDIHRPSFSFQSGWQNAALGLTLLGMLVLAAVQIRSRVDILKMQAKLDEKF